MIQNIQDSSGDHSHAGSDGGVVRSSRSILVLVHQALYKNILLACSKNKREKKPIFIPSCTYTKIFSSENVAQLK